MAETPDARTRTRIATTIVSISVGGIVAASAVALIYSSDVDRPEMARLVFASVLPLLGTWVGTVLAFYFARENQQAAAENTERLLRGRRSSTAVNDVMIPRNRIVGYDLAPGEDVRDVRLAELHERMTGSGFWRVPVFTTSGAVLYVVHRAVINSFAGSLQPGKVPAALTETLGDLLDRADLAELVEAIAFVAGGTGVEDARAAMRSTKGCNDVFVTRSGRRDDGVVGWLTNTDLAGTQ